MNLFDENYWMDRALAMARLAARRGEVPIGCVIVLDGALLASSHDGKELFDDPTAHAEILALRSAAERLGDWRLDGAEMFVTLEPCPMCAGALLHSRVKRLVYAASNPRWGACGADPNILSNPRFNHAVEVLAGVREQKSADLLKATFRQWRQEKQASG